MSVPVLRSTIIALTCQYSRKRANPFPEVTDLVCRLPLPTLFHQLEALHLEDLLRLSVRPTAQTTRSPGFSRTGTQLPDTRRPRALPHPTPPRQPICFKGLVRVKKKRKLFPGPVPASPGSSTLPPTPRCRCCNIEQLPFRPLENIPTFNCFRIGLRIDSPMTKYCSHGTLPHFSLQRSHLNICYYHQDLH